MEDSYSGEVATRGAWTWADLVSTYRFWGLLALLVGSVVGFAALRSTAPLLIIEHGLPLSRTNAFYLVSLGGVPVGLYWAWVGTRSNPRRALSAAMVTQLVGTLVVHVAPSVWTLAPALFVAGIGYGAILLLVPAVLTAGRVSPQGFVIAFGAAFMTAQAIPPLPITQLLFDSISLVTLSAWATFPPIVLGLALFVFTRGPFFDDAPEPRGAASPPGGQHPLLVALFALFVPFYALYWLYRAHEQALTVAPSHQVPSPWAALGLGLLPLLTPIVLAHLAEQLNARAPEREYAPFSAKVVFILTVVFFPIGFALLQDTLNRFVGEQAE